MILWEFKTDEDYYDYYCDFLNQNDDIPLSFWEFKTDEDYYDYYCDFLNQNDDIPLSFDEYKREFLEDDKAFISNIQTKQANYENIN